MKRSIYAKRLDNMGISPRYWNIYQITSASGRFGYKQSLVPLAQEFIQQKASQLENMDIQTALISLFHGKSATKVEPQTCAKSGLCLRCYVSVPIVKACQKIDSLFGGEKQFTYQDLLNFVLDDNGEALIILGKDSKAQLILDENGETHVTNYNFFSVKILQTFNADFQQKMSLDNWTYLQTKQNPEIKAFLAEFGFQHLSDWALLNRARKRQLEQLSMRDRSLVEVFHAVYRRDRQKQRKLGGRKCPDPSTTQLQEMLIQLQQKNIMITSTMELLQQIKQAALLLRQYDIWHYREPLEIHDPETGNYTSRTDLSYDSLDELDLEKSELIDFLHNLLTLALNRAIKQQIHSCLTNLEKSKKYAPFVKQFIPGLHLYYAQGLSLKDIAPKLEMTSWDQARRILNPGELLNKVRISTVQELLDGILKKAKEQGFTKIPPEPDYLRTLTEQIEDFVDGEIFQEAGEEIRAGKNRSMNSFYAQQLRLHLDNINSSYVLGEKYVKTSNQLS